MITQFNSDLTDEQVKDEFQYREFWGLETLVNIYDCDLDLMTDGNHIRRFIEDLCNFIDMKRFGEPIIERFGAGNLYGYSAVQLIHTSCVTAHFAEESRVIYLDVFSCKEFPPAAMAEFAKNYFKGKRVEHKTFVRD